MIIKDINIHPKIITLLGNIRINKNFISLNITGINSVNSLHSENKAK